MKEENEKVIIDETFVLKFEDSTQPAKRIKLEPTVPEAKESKVFVDAVTQTEALDADPKVEIATQTDRPITYFCKLCNESYLSSDIMVSRLIFPFKHKNWNMLFPANSSFVLAWHQEERFRLGLFPFSQKDVERTHR